MRIAVDISLYPLDADYVPPIKDFIERLNGHEGLAVATNAMSTQVAGEHERVFAALEKGGLEVARMEAYPPVKVNRYQDGPTVHRTAASALGASARQFDRKPPF